MCGAGFGDLGGVPGVGFGQNSKENRAAVTDHNPTAPQKVSRAPGLPSKVTPGVGMNIMLATVRTWARRDTKQSVIEHLVNRFCS